MYEDVAGIDINMGCPKSYSIAGGMGAALLFNPELIKDILTTLVKNIPRPITCKVRILATIEETVSLARMIESTGVAALAVHGRFVHERPREPPHYEFIKAVADALTIPVIANGGSHEVNSFAEMKAVLSRIGGSSIMVARAAQWNPSVFRKDGPLPVYTCVRDYLSIAMNHDGRFENCKYCVMQMMHQKMDTPDGQKLLRCKTMEEMCAIFGMDQELRALNEQRATEEEQQLVACKRASVDDNASVVKRFKDERVEAEVHFNRKQWPVADTPKTVLINWCRKQKIKEPAYSDEERPMDRHYRSVALVDGLSYSSTVWERSKKNSQQAAAFVCIKALEIPFQNL